MDFIRVVAWDLPAPPSGPAATPPSRTRIVVLDTKEETRNVSQSGSSAREAGRVPASGAPELVPNTH